MFCKWCGVKRKPGERICSNCQAPFDPMVSTGVPPEMFDKQNKEPIKDEESLNSQESDEVQLKSDIFIRYKKLKTALVIVILVFAAIIFLLLTEIGQLMKKMDVDYDNIIEESKISSDLEDSVYEKTAVPSVAFSEETKQPFSFIESTSSSNNDEATDSTFDEQFQTSSIIEEAETASSEDETSDEDLIYEEVETLLESDNQSNAFNPTESSSLETTLQSESLSDDPVEGPITDDETESDTDFVN